MSLSSNARPLSGLVRGPMPYTPGGVSVFQGSRIVTLKDGRADKMLVEGRRTRLRGLPKLGSVSIIEFNTAPFPYAYTDKIRLRDDTEVPVRLSIRIQLSPGADLVQLVRREGLNILGKLEPELNGELRRLLRNSLNLQYEEANHENVVSHASPKDLLTGARPFFGDAYIIESVADLEIGTDEWRRQGYVIERTSEVAAAAHTASLNRVDRETALELQRLFGLAQQAQLLRVTPVELELLRKVPEEVLRNLPIQAEARVAIAGKVLDNLRSLADMTDASAQDVAALVQRSLAAVEGLSLGSAFTPPVAVASAPSPVMPSEVGGMAGLLASLGIEPGAESRVRFTVEADGLGVRVQLEIAQGSSGLAIESLSQQLRQLLGVDQIEIDLRTSDEVLSPVRTPRA